MWALWEGRKPRRSCVRIEDRSSDEKRRGLRPSHERPNRYNPGMSALTGITVLELSRVLAGPWCGMMLADLGAEVIKLESFDGDDTRGLGPPFRDGVSAYFACCNRNKRSLAIDLRTPAARPLLEALVRHADVLIENYRTGTAEHLGVGWEEMRAINPRLVYCSISGYGRSGPAADRPGYDYVVQAEAGMMAITGGAESPPSKVGVAVADLQTGQNAAIAILAALRHRDRTGRGQRIDVSLFDSQLAGLANVAANVLFTGSDAPRYGNAHPSIVPYEDFPTADGRMMIAVGNDRQFAALAGLLGEPGWAVDPRSATNAARVQHRQWLTAEIGARTVQQPTSHWLERMDALGIPAGPIQDLAQVFADPHVRARGLQLELPGGIPSVRNPIRLSRTPIQSFHPPPSLGEHTDEVLSGTLGLSADEIARLRTDGTVA
jgi:crotonobetainyl-CoA:carnitine CoA-transferase CaiB-like acyl-CoA transferase